MGEGRRERSSKRRRPFFRGQQSCSDSEVANERLKERRAKSRDQLPWPKTIEVLTVDELARYRRRRVQKRPADTLGIDRSGDDEHLHRKLSTEYRRAFRATSEDSLVKRNETVGVGAGFKEVETDVVHMETDNNESQGIPGQVPNRPVPIKRKNSLKKDTNIYTETEYSKYKNHTGFHRPDMLRRSTSLKMEGDMQTVTEQCEKFIDWFNVSRPKMVRVPTNLKLEGQLETTTENHDNYVPFVGARRPEILRQGANLRLEGETTYLPEYTDVFRQPITREKRAPMLPESHLRCGGEFHQKTENTQNFLDPRGSVPINDMSTVIAGNQDGKSDGENHRKKEEEMKMLVSKLEDLKGPPMGVPEYKDAYKNFPRERPKLLKPEDEIGRSDGSKVYPSQNSGRFSTKIDRDPEYKSKFLEKDRSANRRLSMSSRRASTVSSTYGKPRLVPDMRNTQATSEVRSQYIPYGQIPRIETYRMPTNLRSEGRMVLQPEYRDAYCTRRDHTFIEPRHRHRDRSLSASKRGNNWINNNNGEQFGMINAEHDQDAFQVLQTKVHEDNVTGKPPPLGGRRGSRASDARRLSSIDLTKTIKNRSPSPTYRLHVCNVDDEPRGFARRRRSSSVKYTATSPSPEKIPPNTDDIQRPYSPSFGREVPADDQQAFVILDHGHNPPGERLARRRRSRNSIVDGINEGRSKNKTPAGWMPPWYDNASTI